jgi:predicted AlkP superfamily phosphohydrolase/phosphomutase
MKTVVTIVIDSPESDVFDEYLDPLDCIHDLIEGVVVGKIWVDSIKEIE